MNSRKGITRVLCSAYCFSMPRKTSTRLLMTSNDDAVQRMRQQFSEDESLKSQNTWDSLWKSGTTPWDLGKATPVLQSELDKCWGSIKRKGATTDGTFRTLVPGCGAGYDLVALARHHEQWLNSDQDKGEESHHRALVVGLDISESSLADHAAPCVAQALQNDPVSSTRVDLVQGDFFIGSGDTGDDRWTSLFSYGHKMEHSPDSTDEMKFDFIFDYTFFCALPPSLRGAWGAKMASLLQPETGRLLTIMFPILPDASIEVGPPFPVTIDEYRRVLEPHGVYIRHDYGGARASPATVSARSGKELVCWWSHGIGSRGNDAALAKL